MRLKPQAKIALALIMVAGTTIGIKSGMEHGLIPAPSMVKAVMPPISQEQWTSNQWKNGAVSVQRDGDWNVAQSYSNGEDALIGEYRQPDDTTGYPALDSALRYVWNNAGVLMLVFAMLAFLTSGLTSGLLSQTGETHNEQMRREAEELEQPGLSDDIHEPFDAPEGMQPATQYVPIRTRH